MYNTFVFIHSWTRWIVVILAVVAIVNALSGWLGNKTYGKKDNALNASFTGFMHLQLLIGLILYFFLSPLGLDAFGAGMGAVMKNEGLRYWAVEHFTIMLLAVVLVQVGRSTSKKARAAIKKHKRAAIWFSIAFLLMMTRIPWQESARLFRGL
ncbi:MAG: hypothetical protein ACFB0B_02170 [Thermonemataceae bacterium]